MILFDGFEEVSVKFYCSVAWTYILTCWVFGSHGILIFINICKRRKFAPLAHTIEFFSFSTWTASSSSSNPTTSQGKHDVFLSFRGEDTRDNFTSHLYTALTEKKLIPTFIDNVDLARGEEISPSLLEAIEVSKISIVVLSENYASSKWCLEELVKIVDCMRNKGLLVVPVFYGVDPSHVRNQPGSFSVAFEEHEKSLTVSKHKVQSWRAALKDVANFSGWDSLVTR